jgi:HK97 gp10 family phage protein
MSTVTGLASKQANRGLVIARAQQRRSAISGIEFDSVAFMQSLAQHLAAMEVETEDDLVKVGLAVQSKARSLCPVDTGRLRSSIIMTKGRDGQGFYVEVGTNVGYGRFVEFGTVHTRAQPFLVPAVALASGFLRAAVAS